ncbi:hypothetical protein B0H11DRAFT_2306328 [Mycena galericulata]|nr:hypothetical protein B0H11DRAFT_2306328 [Mycena galericulata]
MLWAQPRPDKNIPHLHSYPPSFLLGTLEKAGRSSHRPSTYLCTLTRGSKCAAFSIRAISTKRHIGECDSMGGVAIEMPQTFWCSTSVAQVTTICICMINGQPANREKITFFRNAATRRVGRLCVITFGQTGFWKRGMDGDSGGLLRRKGWTQFKLRVVIVTNSFVGPRMSSLYLGNPECCSCPFYARNLSEVQFCGDQTPSNAVNADEHPENWRDMRVHSQRT